MDYELTSLHDLIGKFLDPEMERVMKAVSSEPKYSDEENQYMVLPSERDVDLPIEEISRLIALSSNKYGNSVRLASLARAKLKIAEAKYKYKLKTSMNQGKNSAEREFNALAAAEVEYRDMTLASVIVEICESIESANRIASESSRRMLLAADQAKRADNRFSDNQGSLKEKDFTSW